VNQQSDRPDPSAPESVPADAKAVDDAVAREYDAQFSDELDGKALDRALLTALLELSGPGPIADVGCGPGHVTRYLSERHQDVRGVDLSPEMLAVARERAPELRFYEGPCSGFQPRTRPGPAS
jgi:trans-aconitate methyltransferase